MSANTKRWSASSLKLLEAAPLASEDMPGYLASLDHKQLDTVWVSAVSSIILEDYPDADLSSLVRCLNIVSKRFRFASAQPIGRIARKGRVA